ncbi:hypothetical protein PtB15_6B153 [Puccinia triticina]|nr:hypothetical protein PtB15_6B153 [Puccinia triticina]
MLPRSQRPLCDRSNQPSHNSAPHALSNGNDPGHQHVAEDHLDALQPTLNHARFHRLRSYAEARERRTEEWAEIENQAAATYLYCQTYSSNWSTGEYPNEHEGLQTTNEQKWASKCPQCFGPKENEVKSDPDEPDFIIAMDGNYQKRHYAYASKDLPTNSQYPPTFLPPSGVNTSEALCEATNVHVTGVEDPCALAHKVADDTRDNTTWQKCDDNGELLLCKFNLAAETTQAARNALDLLNQLPNPYSETGGTYTNIFFQQQWDDERAYHLETTQSYQEKQKKELGHLLCLEEQLEAEWSWEGLSAAQGIARANIASRLSDQILEQRTKVGDPTILENLTGTNGQQKLIKSVRKQAKALHKVLNKYTKQVHTFIRLFPDRTHPRPLEYDELLNLKSEDPFWNNGLFTNENQPWAVDPTTQKGIRHLAALRRGEEEQRRLGWEYAGGPSYSSIAPCYK